MHLALRRYKNMTLPLCANRVEIGNLYAPLWDYCIHTRKSRGFNIPLMPLTLRMVS